MAHGVKQFADLQAFNTSLTLYNRIIGPLDSVIIVLALFQKGFDARRGEKGAYGSNLSLIVFAAVSVSAPTIEAM